MKHLEEEFYGFWNLTITMETWKTNSRLSLLSIKVEFFDKIRSDLSTIFLYLVLNGTGKSALSSVHAYANLCARVLKFIIFIIYKKKYIYIYINDDGITGNIEYF